jgi:hypothetical protein
VKSKPEEDSLGGIGGCGGRLLRKFGQKRDLRFRGKSRRNDVLMEWQKVCNDMETIKALED